MTHHVHVVPAERIEAHGIHHLLTSVGFDSRLGHGHDEGPGCGGVVALWLGDGDATADPVTIRARFGDVPILLVLESEEQLRHVPGPGPCAATVLATQGSDSLVAAVNGLLSEGEPTEQPPASPDRPLLTQREAEIAQLIASGWRNDEIAGELGISPHTVRTHTQSLRHKLDVQHRLALVAKLPGVSTGQQVRRPRAGAAADAGGRSHST